MGNKPRSEKRNSINPVRRISASRESVVGHTPPLASRLAKGRFGPNLDLRYAIEIDAQQRDAADRLTAGFFARCFAAADRERWALKLS